MDEIFLSAVQAGCQPFWHDGILGPAWHCGCAGNKHGFDRQCSMIPKSSIRRAEAAAARAYSVSPVLDSEGHVR
jgi:hypothetical protein